VKRISLTQQQRNDAVHSGVLMVLGVVYNFEPDPTATLTQEIVGSFSSADLLRVAKQEQDCYLPLLRKTIKSLRRPRSRRQAGESLSAAELFAKGQQLLKGGR
jgi:hypothetical protein